MATSSGIRPAGQRHQATRAHRAGGGSLQPPRGERICEERGAGRQRAAHGGIAIDLAPPGAALVATLEEALRAARICAALARRAEFADGNGGLAEVRAQLARAETLVAGGDVPCQATPDRRHLASLTTREVEVLRLVAAGRSNREMAQHLGRSERTIERHLENLYRKIGARNRADATAYALRHRLT